MPSPAETIRTIISSFTKIRIQVISAPGMGHESNAVSVLEYLGQRLGFSGVAEILYDPEALPDLRTLLNNPSLDEGSQFVYKGVNCSFHSLEDFDARRDAFSLADLAFTAGDGYDRYDAMPNLAQDLKARAATYIPPFKWDESFLTWTSLLLPQEVPGSLSQLVPRVPPSWEDARAALDDNPSLQTDKGNALCQILGSLGDFAWQFLYGLNVRETGDKTRIYRLLQLIVANKYHQKQCGEDKPLLMMLAYAPLDDEIKTLNGILRDGVWPADAPADLVSAATPILQQFNFSGFNASDVSDPSLPTQVAQATAGDVIFAYVGRLPRDIFDYFLTHSFLPPTAEGQNAQNVLFQAGVPFFHTNYGWKGNGINQTLVTPETNRLLFDITGKASAWNNQDYIKLAEFIRQAQTPGSPIAQLWQKMAAQMNQPENDKILTALADLYARNSSAFEPVPDAEHRALCEFAAGQRGQMPTLTAGNASSVVCDREKGSPSAEGSPRTVAVSDLNLTRDDELAAAGITTDYEIHVDEYSLARLIADTTPSLDRNTFTQTLRKKLILLRDYKQGSTLTNNDRFEALLVALATGDIATATEIKARYTLNTLIAGNTQQIQRLFSCALATENQTWMSDLLQTYGATNCYSQETLASFASAADFTRLFNGTTILSPSNVMNTLIARDMLPSLQWLLQRLNYQRDVPRINFWALAAMSDPAKRQQFFEVLIPYMKGPQNIYFVGNLMSPENHNIIRLLLQNRIIDPNKQYGADYLIKYIALWGGSGDNELLGLSIANGLNMTQMLEVNAISSADLSSFNMSAVYAATVAENTTLASNAGIRAMFAPFCGVFEPCPPPPPPGEFTCLDGIANLSRPNVTRADHASCAIGTTGTTGTTGRRITPTPIPETTATPVPVTTVEATPPPVVVDSESAPAASSALANYAATFGTAALTSLVLQGLEDVLSLKQFRHCEQRLQERWAVSIKSVARGIPSLIAFAFSPTFALSNMAGGAAGAASEAAARVGLNRFSYFSENTNRHISRVAGHTMHAATTAGIFWSVMQRNFVSSFLETLTAILGSSAGYVLEQLAAKACREMYQRSNRYARLAGEAAGSSDDGDAVELTDGEGARSAPVL